MYDNVTACVRTKDGKTDSFMCNIGLKQGCLASSKLFSLFINELVKYLHNSGARGIQLQPGDDEICSLMFADDVALIADTVCGLQRQLNALQIFCKDNLLNVNTKKTKIVIFRNGGRPSSKEKWLYEGNELLIEQSFTYVGITFSSARSLSQPNGRRQLCKRKASIK